MTAPMHRGLPLRPILVAGAGRSGTTWLGKLLDASPWVLYRHEPDNLRRLDWFRDVPSRIEPEDPAPRPREAFQEALWRCAERHALHFIRPPRFRKAFLRNGTLAALELALRAAGRLQRTRSPELPLPGLLWHGDAGRARLVVKSVTSNMRLAWIRRHFPEIRIVLIVRHPGGYLSSWMRGSRSEGWRGFGDRGRLDPTVLPLRRREHARWLDRYEKGTPFERELIYWIVANETPLLELGRDEGVTTVVYEDLCEAPASVVARVYEACDLEMGAQTRGFVEASTSRHDERFHAVFKDPRKAASEWRERLAEAEVERVEGWLAETSLAPLWEAA